jgi:hypothetical protein
LTGKDTKAMEAGVKIVWQVGIGNGEKKVEIACFSVADRTRNPVICIITF